MIELNRIYNENCLDTMKRMEDNFIDLTVTSPPYDNLRDYNGYDFDFESIAKELFRVTKQGGVVVWVVGDATINGSETGASFKQALYFKEIGFNLHDTMIYNKINAVPLNHNRYEQSFEYIFILVKGQIKTFNPIREKTFDAGKTIMKRMGNSKSNLEKGSAMRLRDNAVKIIVSDTKIKTNIFSYAVGSGQTTSDSYAFEHPAMFPEKLAQDMIFSWSNENDIVYDCFAGSGTTSKMAIRLKRQFVASEISADYCKIINKRIDNELIKINLFN